MEEPVECFEGREDDDPCVAESSSHALREVEYCLEGHHVLQ